MGTVSVPSLTGTDPFTVNGATFDGKVDPLVTEFNGSIENVNVSASAAIANSKLNLAAITQAIAHSGAMTHTAVLTMTGKELLLAKGADVASGTSATLLTDGNQFDVTGTTDIETLTTKQAGSVIWLKFDGALDLIDDTGNLELQGSNLTVAAEDVVCLLSDGTLWHLVSHPHRAVSADQSLDGSMVQRVHTQSSAVAQSSGTAVYDDSVPTLTECPVIAALNTAITAGSTDNKLYINVLLNVSADSSAVINVVCLFLDGGSSAIAAVALSNDGSSDLPAPTHITFETTAADTNAHTYKVGMGAVGGAVFTINGQDGGRKLGGVQFSSMTITEVKAS